MRPTVDSRTGVTCHRSSSRFVLLLTLLVALPLAVTQGRPTGGGATFDPACSDPRAIAIADLALRAVGGPEGLERVHFLRFSFVLLRGEVEVIRRTHLWDRVGKRLRYESLDAGGSPLVAILNLVDPEGRVYRAGRQVEEPLASRLRAEVYDAWRSDAYWLLMPYRLKDPGICMEYGGEVVVGDGRYDRLYLTFSSDDPAVPGGRYRADFDRQTHLLALWSGAAADERPVHSTTVWTWGDWRRRDGLLFALEKESFTAGEAVRIIHPVLEIDEQVSEDAFISGTPRSPATVP